MTDTTSITVILAVTALLVFTVYHLIHKTGRSKRFTLLTLAAFIVVAIAAGCTDSSLSNPTADKTAVEQSASLQQEEKQVSEPSASQEEHQPETSSAESPTVDKQELAEEKSAVSGTLKVHFIDVGQADSILVQLSSG
ncbi:hypothetical protein [Calderihabitans maritimus]|uniref:Competence protein n=1 Tax=Calderihabitans maritimus TaxID=1246530 RepID=A0A1Z5HTA3_9FIRM|nr:hypothetical protein [Calderihabitans maritimus]GAW92766.1 competence protein [Calderihabitans maritimus]